ncbi:FAD-binding domain-containing protein [Xylariaceae sp. FL0255]|nr:FAD-binding domain-containing protein [Xylariaceae sp. FL0255]
MASQTCWDSPAAYIQPETTQQVAEALAILKNTCTKFALRTHGHTPNPGFSSIGKNGVVLDLHKLCSIISFDKEAGILHVGAGGYPAIPNLHGTGADGVCEFEVVLSDSTIVTANAEKNMDLYRSLKGGGSNFGIVTSVKLKVYPLIKVQYSTELYAETDISTIMQATVEVQAAMENNPNLNLFVNVNAGFIVIGLISANGPDERSGEFKPISNLTSKINTAVPVTNGTISFLAQAMSHATDLGRRTIGSVTTNVSGDLYKQIYSRWKEVISKLPTGMGLHYTIQPFSAAGAQAGEILGRNIMGLEKASQCWWVFTAEWTEADNDRAARDAVDTMVEYVQEVASVNGLLLRYITMNFANLDQNVLGSYGQEAVDELRRVASKYDPEGVFQKLQNGGFLLRDM